MELTQFILNHLLSVLGGLSVIITGLSAFLGKTLSERIILKEKANISRELKILEREIQLDIKSKELFSQISSETYKKIFEKKIEIYSSLLTSKNNYIQFDKESHIPEVDDPTNDYYRLYVDFRKIIENNKLYISNNLSNAYENWYIQASPYLKEAKIKGYQTYGNTHCNNDIDRDFEVELAQNQKISEMIIKTKDDMEIFIKQIDTDVAEIRLTIEKLVRT